MGCMHSSWRHRHIRQMRVDWQSPCDDGVSDQLLRAATWHVNSWITGDPPALCGKTWDMEWHPHVTWYQYQGRPVCFSSKWMGRIAGIHRIFTSDFLHPPWSRGAFQCYPSTDSCIRGSSACQTDDWRNSSSDHEPWSEQWAMCLEAWCI